VVGVTGSFFVVDEGGVWIVTYEEQCKSIARMGGRNKTVRGASGNTFTVEDGLWFVTYDRRCKEQARRGRGGAASAKRANDLGAPEIQRAVPVAEPRAPLTPFYQSSAGQTFSVVGIAAGDTLNVRNGPSAANGVTIQLPNGYGGITIIGSPVMNDSTEWVNTRFRDGSGWVNSQYLRVDSE
jgi:hypothetical protein